MTSERSFPAEPQSVAAARRFALQAVRAAEPDERQAVELMVSELATNCIRHTGTSFHLRVRLESGEVCVEVTDSAGGTPQMRSPAANEPNGRGLQIVNLLSTAWGVDGGEGDGKTVWFRLTVSARAA